MKLIDHKSITPYKLGNNYKNSFSRLSDTASKILERCTFELSPIISRKFPDHKPSETENKLLLFEALVLGVLWFNHADKANSIKDSTLAEIEHLINVARSSSSSEVLKNAYYGFRNQQLTSDFSGSDYPLELSLATVKKLMQWLLATEEYQYETKIINDWYINWQKLGDSYCLFEMNAILRCTQLFYKICNSELSQIFNNQYFETTVSEVAILREDYFQVTKPVSEYYLNAIGAVWMNQLNKPYYNRYKDKLVIAPGCMRPKNGTECQAIPEGKYMQCTNCNHDCNINKLVEDGNLNGYDVLIALHQSTFKADEQQLKNKGIIGVACMSCLVSGGLMLLDKKIHAQCAILEQPGCNKHWTMQGIMTDVNFNELRTVVNYHAPSSCSSSDS